MAFDVALTFAQRDNLYSLQRTEDYQDRTQRRLASGREVNDVTDDVFRYFAARSLSERADEFIGYNEATEQAIQNVKTSINTIDSIRELFKQIKGIIQGSAGKTGAELAALNQPLIDTLQEAGQILVDGQYQGTRFIQSSTEKLTVRFSERFTLDIESDAFFSLANRDEYTGELFTFAANLDTVTPHLNNLLTLSAFVTPAPTVPPTTPPPAKTDLLLAALSQTSGKGEVLNAIVDNVNLTIKALSVRAQELGTYVGILQARKVFTEGYTRELKVGTDAYTLADINQEGAYLVALQTRQQLALNGLAVSGRQQNAVLTLLQ